MQHSKWVGMRGQMSEVDGHRWWVEMWGEDVCCQWRDGIQQRGRRRHRAENRNVKINKNLMEEFYG